MAFCGWGSVVAWPAAHERGEHSGCRGLHGSRPHLGLSQEWSIEETLRLACAVSALAVTQIGVGIADQQQLTTLMASINVQKIS